MQRNLLMTTLAVSILLVGIVIAGSGNSPVREIPGQAAMIGSLQVNNTKGLELKPMTAKKAEGTFHSISLKGEVAPMTVPTAALTGAAGQAGEDIATATVIPPQALPFDFSETGVTIGMADDYDESCVGAAGGSPDAVYSYTPASVDELVDIMLCKSDFTTHLWVYENDVSTVVACNRFYGPCGLPRSGILAVPMFVGNTYYIVIDGENGSSGNYWLEMHVEAVPILHDSSTVHPAFAQGPNGNMILVYEENNYDTTLPVFTSTDYGVSWPVGASWLVSGSYPDMEYWGDDTVFYGTMVPKADEAGGANNWLFDIKGTQSTDYWGLSSWPWDGYGWHDMRAVAIAVDNLGLDWKWGIQSMVHSSSYTTPDDLIDAPHIFYPTDADGYATISWYGDVNGCNSTDVDIDRVTRISYAAYDWLDPATGTWSLFVRSDSIDFLELDPGPDSYAWTYTAGTATEHVQNPAVAAHNGNILIITEYWDEAVGTDRDLICWTGSQIDGELGTLTTTVVVATEDMEQFPEISHLAGASFIVTFVRGDTLFATQTDDAGTSWATPEVVSLVPDDAVVNELRTSEIADKASDAPAKVIYEYRNPSIFPDTSIFLHFAPLAAAGDSDGDGIPDVIDNCPFEANPSQEDSDGDGAGDACDPCPNDPDDDADGDGVCGDIDNCPAIANPGQEDADGDGIGDVCDACSNDPDNDVDGDGFCADVDNCPTIANPGQEDEDNNGVGDACCCIGIRGDASSDGTDLDIVDLTIIVDYLFGVTPVIGCVTEADVDGNGAGPDIVDLTFIVDYLFGDVTPAPVPCPY